MATTSIGAPGVTFPDSSVQATAGALGTSVITSYTSPGTWTKPSTVKSIKVTVVGGGGSGGSGTGSTQPSSPFSGFGGSGGGGGIAVRSYPAASLSGPQPFTVGGSNANSAFGVAPATVITGGAGGAGTPASSPGFAPAGGAGGGGGSGTNGQLNFTGGPGNPSAGTAGDTLYSTVGNARLYGGGGSGGVSGSPAVAPGTAGAQGIVIIEEFY